MGHINQQLSRAMKRDAGRWNQRQPRDSFIRLTMQVKDRPLSVLTPSAASETMRIKITCPSCSCRYAIIGAAFFCPGCGHDAADIVFDQSMAAVRNAINSLPAIRAAMPDRDSAETTARLIIESSLLNAVSTFQRYAEVLYGRYPAASKARRNAFQNLSEGSELWLGATGYAYSHYFDSDETATLLRFFQQRHLLVHTQGIIDADYISRTGDTSNRIGQRLVLRETAIHECLALIEKLGSAMAAEPSRRNCEAER